MSGCIYVCVCVCVCVCVSVWTAKCLHLAISMVHLYEKKKIIYDSQSTYTVHETNYDNNC